MCSGLLFNINCVYFPIMLYR